MILNTFFKVKKINLTNTQKGWLGRNIIRVYKSKYPESEIKKVRISENGCKMLVIDYPKEFLESSYVNKVIARFLKKHINSKITRESIFKIVYNYQTKNEKGFLILEIDDLLKKSFPTINKSDFDNELGCVTCTMDENRNTIIFRNDIENAIIHGLGINNNIDKFNWD